MSEIRTKKHTLSSRYHARCRSKYVEVPEIRLNGKWLEALGFESGKMFEIQMEKNRIVLKMIE